MSTNTVPYGYEYQTQYTAAAGMWKPGAGNGRNITGITIHHWGDSLTASFEGIRNWLCSSRPSNPTSAHYIAQGADADGTPRPIVACIVAPADIAYACGNWSANLTQISIECRPNMRDADYAVIAELVARLRNTYNIPRSELYPHRHWVATSCPGAYDLPRIDREAAAWNAAHPGGTPAPTPAPAPQEDIMATLADLKNLLTTDPDVKRAVALAVHGYKNPDVVGADASAPDAYQLLVNAAKPVDVDALAAAVVAKLPAGTGTLTQADVQAALHTVLAGTTLNPGA